MSESYFIDAQDNFDRLFVQTKAVITALASNNQIDCLDKETLRGTLNLVLDRFIDIESAYKQILSSNT